jgi:Protein of unknown function, DUF547
MRDTERVHQLKKAAVAFWIGVVGLALGGSGCAHVQRKGFDHTHSEWKAIIDQHVTSDGAETLVAYSKLLVQKDRVDAYVARLGAVTEGEYRDFSRDQQLVFLVNAYNAFTIQQVLEVYPIGSIQEIEFEAGVDAWNKKKHRLIGKVISLNQLENEWIRPWFKEPLIHFALNCAAIGCPGLRWYSAAGFTAQATEAARIFLNDSRRTVFDSKARTFKISELFDWYKDDFIAASGSVAAYLAQFIQARSEIDALSKAGTLKVELLPYDWALNEKK